MNDLDLKPAGRCGPNQTHLLLFSIVSFSKQSKSDHFAASIIQTAAAKSHLHSAVVQLRLALSARDNLESLFSYVEEEEERNRGKSVSFSFTPPFLFALSSPSPPLICPSLYAGGMKG